MKFFYRILSLGLAFAAVIGNPLVVYAYVGPGVGITLLGALWAVLAAVILAIVGILVWPIRALLRRRRRSKEAAAELKSSGL